MTDWKTLNYAVVDVEGNGQQPPDLVELAVVPIRSGVIGEPMSWLVKPETSIKHFATRIHGLTNKDLAECPAFADVSGHVLAALDADALVAHNAHIDLGVLQHRATYDALVAARLFVLLATRAGSVEALRGDPPEGGGDEAPTLF